MARKQGAANKLNGAAKENITAVFTRLGGTAAMADWARENLTEFYRIYSKLIPLQQEVDGSLRVDLVWPLPKSKLDQ